MSLYNISKSLIPKPTGTSHLWRNKILTWSMDQLKLTNLPNFGKSNQNHNFSKIIKIPIFNIISIGFNKNRLSQFLGVYNHGGAQFQKSCTIPGKTLSATITRFYVVIVHHLC